MTAARIVITLLLFAQIAPEARAAWVPDGNILTAYRGDVANPQLAPDGRGGVFVTWLDDTKAPFVSRLAGDGTYPPDWPSAGRYAVAKYRLDGYVQSPTVVADGLGGCYVVWVHASEGCISFCGNLPGRVYVQRLESSSAIDERWSCRSAPKQTRPALFKMEVGGRDGAQPSRCRTLAPKRMRPALSRVRAALARPGGLDP